MVRVRSRLARTTGTPIAPLVGAASSRSIPLCGVESSQRWLSHSSLDGAAVAGVQAQRGFKAHSLHTGALTWLCAVIASTFDPSETRSLRPPTFETRRRAYFRRMVPFRRFAFQGGVRASSRAQFGFPA